MKRNWWLSVMICAALVVLSIASSARAQASLPPLTPYIQNFDTLVNTGSSNTMPQGWAFSESGSNANTTYTAGTGSDTAGDTYSLGSSGSSERALGGLASNSLISTIGAGFTNNTGGTIGQILISYHCEQWRFGQTGRGTYDRMDFQYSTNATSVSNGTWTDVDTLDCTTTDISGTAGSRDGNTFRNTPSTTIAGLNIPNGSNFWIRWVDANIASTDDALAVDDFALNLFTPTAVTLNDLAVSSTSSPAPVAIGVIGLGAAALLLRRRAIRRTAG